MSLLKKLFGGLGGRGAEEGAAESAAGRVVAEETYEGYRIAAAPVAEGGQYRLAATISKEVDGETKTHKLIRADLFASQDEAASYAIRKARQVIDEQGTRLFS